MTPPKLSVIIPVYKCEAYIDNCLDSIRRQTLRDIEIICIHDGSPDGSLAKLRRHAAEDDRIKVIDQDNHGPAIARNVGLDMATGEYIGFLDSDDFVEPDYYESMLRMAEAHDADIVLNNHVMREDNTGSHPYRGSDYLKQLPEGEFLDKFFAADHTICLLYAHLYRGSMIRDRHVRFQTQKFLHEDDYFHEDEFFHRVVHYYADKVFAYSGPEYHYVAHEGSIMATRGHKNMARVRCFAALRDYFGDLIYEKSFKLKLLCPTLYSDISDDMEFKVLKEYILSIQDHVKHSGAFVSDFDHFAMAAILESTSAEECTAKLGKLPYARYQTRMRMMPRTNVVVSVIIPMYNVQDRLAKCLESVCSQTFRGMEIICVNDCSTDGTLEVVRNFSAFDIRMKLVNLPERVGTENARQKGKDAAKGKYVCYVNPDDCIAPDYIATFVNKMEADVNR